MKKIVYNNYNHNVKDVDEKKGIVSFYFANFNSVDSHGRKFEKNAFNSAIPNTSKIKHLWNHNSYKVVGKPIEIGTDENGAYMRSQLLSNTDDGRKMFELYKNGIITEHSFGYYINESHKGTYKNKQVEIVEQVKLVEASSLTEQAANPNTPTISLNTYSDIVDIIKNEFDAIKEILNSNVEAKKVVEATKDTDAQFNSLITLLEGLKK